MRRFLLLSLSFACTTSPLLAADYDLAVDSSIRYVVKHPMHVVNGVSKQLTLLKKPQFDPNKPHDFSGVKDIPLQIAWKSFDSGNANRDSNTLMLVKASQFPNITYVIESLAQGVAQGRLYIAGHKQAVTAAVTIDSSNPERLLVKTHSKIKMSDFGIEPPSLLLIAAEDEVNIYADLVFKPAQP